jgi:hypothetical protein
MESYQASRPKLIVCKALLEPMVMLEQIARVMLWLCVGEIGAKVTPWLARQQYRALFFVLNRNNHSRVSLSRVSFHELRSWIWALSAMKKSSSSPICFGKMRSFDGTVIVNPGRTT